MTGAARGTAHSGILLGVAQFWLAAAGYVVAVVLGRVLGPEAYGIYGIIYSLLLGIELVDDRDTKAPARAAAERVLYRALSRGLSFKTTMGNVLTLTPPLIVTRSQMDAALDILDACLAEETTAA